MEKNGWKRVADKNAVMQFAEGYRQFISQNKTERECVASSIKIAEAHGYMNLQDCINNKRALAANDKVYVNYMNKALALFVVGSEPIEKGMTILGAHIDSPRLDLKQHPVYEDHDIALMDTHYYGGIKSYQWVTLPLALHGVICKKDGSTVNVVIGEDPNDVVVGISDLLPHLAAKQMERKPANIIEGEDLNVTVGSIPLEGEEKEAVKANVLAILKARYGIDEDDFMSAEIEVVPAGQARNYGLDSSMIMGYGQDDRVCAYTSLMAMFEVDAPKKTLACLLVDKEEVGSIGATGMHSKFFENAVAELSWLKEGYNEMKVRRALANSKMLSSDVSAAFDPNYAFVNEMNNTCFFGNGLVINKYTGSRGKSGSNDASAEYLAEVRRAFDAHDVVWQTSELGKVNEGGGGTIAYIMGNYGMNVVDSGVAVQNMHAPWEVTSKMDVYQAKQGYVAFLKEM